LAGDLPLELRTSAGPIRYLDVGDGEPLVFVHGVLADGQLWRKVVPLLAGRYRCIVPDWPLGSHKVLMSPDADLSPPGLARIIVEFLDGLGVEPVTLIGNDTGGALCQVVATEHSERVERLVLTPCDAYENFPPRAIFWPLQMAARLPGGLFVLAQALRLPIMQRLPFSFAGLTKTLDPSLVNAWLTPARTDRAVRRDLAKVIRGLNRSYTLNAAKGFRDFTQPTLIAWAPEAKFFTMRYGERLAADLPTARLERIDNAYAFVSEDQPERTAQLIADFVDASPKAQA
jgi:pimeloyl-ACP methyl ester carboxylesterase